MKVVVPGGGTPLPIVVVPHVRCRELEGVHFDTDKSFVRPDGLPTLGAVAGLLAADPNRRAIVFGHTDTVGADDHNKRLSEKRARALFAALTHTPSVWEELHGAEKWGIATTQVIVAAVAEPGDPAPSSSGQLDAATIEAVKAFQRKHPPLDVDGDPGPNTRRELFLAYFKKGNATAVDATRFVPFDGSPFMGCGEFNPFTEGAADQASRRVSVQVFDRSAEPADLPCKIGDLGPCRANLLAPGEAPDDPPKMAHFRCKVYRAIERRCNSKPPKPPVVPPRLKNGKVTPAGTDALTVRVKVLDVARKPLPEKSDVTIVAGEFRTFAQTDAKGVVVAQVPKGTKEVTLSYAPADATALISCKVALELPAADTEAGVVARLENLGYPAKAQRGFALWSFQKDHGLPVTLALDDATRARVAEVHGG
jgi:hypothetical protein